jgi:energy-coupling factor transporter ATP-binding protein EcfA2
MKPYFELRDFSFAFKQDGLLFFDHITVQAQKPGLTFIVGKNGIGKSTLFRVLQGIVYPGERITGILRVQNDEYDLSSPSERNRLYYKAMILHQNFDLMLTSSFTGLQNLSFARFAQYPKLSIPAPIDHSTELADRFALPLHRPVKMLSGGQRQMLAMLMVAQHPLDLLLLDEPTAALDEHNSEYVMQGLVSLVQEKGISVLAIVHDYDVVKKYAQNLIKISCDEQGQRTLALE